MRVLLLSCISMGAQQSAKPAQLQMKASRKWTRDQTLTQQSALAEATADPSCVG